MTEDTREWYESIARALEETVDDTNLRVTQQAFREVLRPETHVEVFAAVYELLPELARHSITAAGAIRELLSRIDTLTKIIIDPSPIDETRI